MLTISRECLQGGEMLAENKINSLKEEFKYYSYDEIDKCNATYNLIIGQRSNGKTFGMLKKIIDEYLATGTPSAYIRRLDEQIKPTYISFLFNPLSDYLREKTNGKYTGFDYRLRAFYFMREETDGSGRTTKTKDKTPFCRTYSINTHDTSKGADAGKVRYVVFDEFITRQYYLSNEFVMFQNVLSSIIRNRDGVQIYMLANTVNKYCPYFADMGIKDVADMEQGTINLYTVGKTKTTIAVEYCAPNQTSQKVSKYFAFDNPQLNMITDGSWEIALYRHAPPQLNNYPIMLSFFIVYHDKIVQGDIYLYKQYPIIFYHPKTTQLQHPERDIIYYEEMYDGNPLHMMTISGGLTRAQKLIEQLIKTNRTFYSDNSTGELVNNWLKFALIPGLLK